MLSEIHNLKKLLMEQKNVTEVTFAAHQKQIEAEKTRNDQQQTTITEQQTKIDSLTKELSRVSHVEHGVVDCHSSESWNDGTKYYSWNRNGQYTSLSG